MTARCGGGSPDVRVTVCVTYVFFCFPAVSKLSTASVHHFHVLSLFKCLPSQSLRAERKLPRAHAGAASVSWLPAHTEPGLGLLPAEARSRPPAPLASSPTALCRPTLMFLASGKKSVAPSPRESLMASQPFDCQTWVPCLSRIFQAQSSPGVFHLRQASCL